MSNPDDWAFYDQQAAQELLRMQRAYSDAADAQACVSCGDSRMIGDVLCATCRADAPAIKGRVSQITRGNR